MDLSDLEPWPVAQLGYPLRAGYSYKTIDQRQFTAMTAGAPVARLASHVQLLDLSFTLQLTEGQENYFRWWLANKLNHGTDYFTLDIKTGGGLNTVAVLFAKNGVGQSTPSGTGMRIACKAIGIGNPAAQMSEQLATDLLTINPRDLQIGLALLRKTLHEDW